MTTDYDAFHSFLPNGAYSIALFQNFERMRSVNTITRILLISLAFILLLIMSYYTVLREFYIISKKEFVNPGIYTAFDEQGIAYDEQSKQFLFCGYMRDKTASAVYVADPQKPQNPEKISLKNMDGSDFTGHAGGIVVHGEYLYIAGSTDDCIYVFDRDSIINPQSHSSQCIGVFPLKTSKEDGIRASFLGVSDEGSLLVGEFDYRPAPSCRCRKNHTHFYENNRTHAYIVEFKFDSSMPLGLEEKPNSVICIQGRIQGASLSDNKLVLSRSFGLSASSILYYDYSGKVQNGTVSLLGSETPLYVLPEPYRIVRAFPLTEGVEIVDSKVFIASELCNFFPRKLFKLFAPEWCYSLQLF